MPHKISTTPKAIAETPKAIAFIDTAVPDWKTLVDGVTPGTEVILLDSNPLLSLWENKSESQIFNCRYSGDLSVYFLTEWRESRFLIKVLCSKHPGLFSAESDRRGLITTG